MPKRRAAATPLRAEADSFAQAHVYAREKRAQILIAPDFEGLTRRLAGEIQKKSTNLSTGFVDIAESTTCDR
jgi:hypothetical protein